MSAILLAVRVFGVALFGTAAWGKLRHWREFVGVLGNYGVVSEALVAPAATGVLALELLTVIGLAAGNALGVVLAIMLLLGFAGAMLAALAQGRREIDCGCFSGALRQRVSGALVAHNLALAAPFALLLRPGVPMDAMALLDGIAAGTAFFLLYVAAGSIVSLRARAAALAERFA